MSGSWIAGCVRARLLASERRLGGDGARDVASAASLPAALALLGRSPYRREADLELDLTGAQRALAVKVLLDLRLLAGWLPGDALGLLRALAGWFEIANVDDRLAYLGGAPLREPFELGSLATAWPRAAETQSAAELRRALASSAWGDPGDDLSLGLRRSWARRVQAEVPELRALADEALTAGDWLAEARWWGRCESQALVLLHAPLGDRRVVAGAAALLAVDAHRLGTALAACARRGLPGVEEVLDAA